jgi:hypothetical protein
MKLRPAHRRTQKCAKPYNVAALQRALYPSWTRVLREAFAQPARQLVDWLLSQLASQDAPSLLYVIPDMTCAKSISASADGDGEG